MSLTPEQLAKMDADSGIQSSGSSDLGSQALNVANGVGDFLVPETKTGLNDIITGKGYNNTNTQGDVGASLGQAVGNLPKFVGSGARSATELASYYPALWEAKGTRAARFAKGALGGFLSSVSKAEPNQEGVKNVATGTLASGALNTVIPGLLDKAASVVGKTALGKGGEKLAELSRESGNKIQGSAEEIGNTLFEKTKPITDKLMALLQDAPGGMTKQEFLDKAAKEALNSGPGSSNHAADYVSQIEKKLDAMIKDRFPAETSLDQALHSIAPDVGEVKPGTNPIQQIDKPTIRTKEEIIADKTAKKAPLIDSRKAPSSTTTYTPPAPTPLRQDFVHNVGDGDLYLSGKKPLPATFWNEFQDSLQKDVKNKAWGQPLDPATDAKSAIAKKLTGSLTSDIADMTTNPEEVTRLNKLRGAASDIRNSTRKTTNAGDEGTVQDTLKALKVPASVATFAASHNPLAFLSLLSDALKATAPVSTRVANNLGNKTFQKGASAASNPIIQNLINSFNPSAPQEPQY